MAHTFSALELLRSLGDFGDPLGAAARLQVDSLLKDLRRHATEHPEMKYRLTVDGPEQTIAEILADLDEDDAAIVALKAALKGE